MIPHPRPIPTVSRAQSFGIGPQIQTVELAEYYSSLSRNEWLIVAWRDRHGGPWMYYWPAADTKTWNRSVAAGKVLVVQRSDGSRTVALGKLAR